MEQDDEIYEEELTLSGAEVARQLRALADMFEAGSLSLEGLSAPLPDSFFYQIEYERDDDDEAGSDEVLYELEIAIGWSVPAGDEENDEDEDEEAA